MKKINKAFYGEVRNKWGRKGGGSGRYWNERGQWRIVGNKGGESLEVVSYESQ